MAARNDITGDSIQTKGTTEQFRNNYDLIFGKKKTQPQKENQNASDRKNQERSNGSDAGEGQV